MIKDAVKLGTFIFMTKFTYDFLDSFARVTLKFAIDKMDSKLEDERVEENEDES